ncbi:MAG: restriction endonuclease subunit S [Methanothrix sp.]|nr:restriction endonuclease subunit S [Methanothrix sp.]
MTGYTNPVPIGDIPEGWKIQSIDSLCRNITSGGTPLRSISRFYQNGTIKWIKTKELKDWYIDDSEEKITEEALEESSAKLFPPNTVLMAMYGDGRTITSLGILRTESATNQACCALIANPDVCYHLYLFYSLKYHRADFIQLATGGAQRNLSGTLIRNFAIRVPPLVEQHAIARILSSLDDKIELNRRMNETLEAMARAIFKSWFVDFDPVRAKTEGRGPVGMDAETAALFPDSFEETELGMVPRRWKVGSFDETIDLIGGGTPKTSVPEYWNGDIHWFSIVDAPENSNVFVIDTEKKITKRGLEGSSTRLLSKGTTIITARGTVGKCALVGNPMTMNQSCYGVHARDQRGDYFIYFALRNLVSELRRSTHGSVFDTITSETFKSVQTVIVPVELTRIFDKKISSFMERILSSLRESETLVLLRNALLPKLLSGEIRLKDSGMSNEANQWT